MDEVQIQAGPAVLQDQRYIPHGSSYVTPTPEPEYNPLPTNAHVSPAKAAYRWSKPPGMPASSPAYYCFSKNSRTLASCADLLATH